MASRVSECPARRTPRPLALHMLPRRRGPIRHTVERLLALGYGSTYDAIVRSFDPYQALLREIAGFVARSHATHDLAAVTVVDVACGTGTVALDLARRGYSVVGLDVVEPLVTIARDHAASMPDGRLAFQQLDVATDPIPGAGTYDVLVSMHTLYWHPDPRRLLEGCRRILKPGGHAIFLTYCRPARMVRTVREIRARDGIGPALRSLQWLVPTAVFELFRDFEPHYIGPEQFHAALADAGFEVLEARRTFLADISLLAWVRAKDAGAGHPI